MVNARAIVESANDWENYGGPRYLEDFYYSRGISDPYRFASSWVSSKGNLDFIYWERAQHAAEFIKEHTRQLGHIQSWEDGERLQRAKKEWLQISGTVFHDWREPWRSFMVDHYYRSLTYAWAYLRNTA
jgi:hypothetical protein